MTTTVVGVGNLLLGDEGVGVWLLERLRRRYAFEPAVELLDGGTLGLALTAHLVGTDRLLILDAAVADAPPGTIVELRLDDLPTLLNFALSAHDASVGDLVAAMALLGEAPSDVAVIGIVPQTLAPPIGLSDVVGAALGDAELAVLARLAAWDITARSPASPDIPPFFAGSGQTEHTSASS